MEERQGVLIKGESKNGIGYFEYFPWKQFHDLDIEVFLSELLDPTSQTYKRVTSAIEEIIVFLKKPSEISFYNHQLIYPHTTANEIGASTVKLKYMGSISQLIDAVNRIAPIVKAIRIDFNYALTLEKLAQLFSQLRNCSEKIEYIEDPVPFNPETYNLLRTWDHLVRIDQYFNHTGIDCGLKRIYRPSISSIPFENIREDDIFSSYMGHPLGKILCAVILSKYGNENQYHGIETPPLYEDELKLFERRGEKITLIPSLVNELVRKLEELSWKSF